MYFKGECFKGVYMKFLEGFKEVLRVFHGKSNVVLIPIGYWCNQIKMLVGKIEGCFNEVLSEFQGYLKKASRVFEGTFTKIPKKNFQGCFKSVSMKFCFAIFLHGTHRKSQLPKQKEGLFSRVFL